MAQQTDSRLLGLPRELRDLVYEHLFGGTEFDLDTEFDSELETKLPGILKTCTQLRHEALKPFFKLTTFRYREDGFSSPHSFIKKRNMVEILARMPSEHFALITHLKYEDCTLMAKALDGPKFVAWRKASQLKMLEEDFGRKGLRLRPGVMEVELLGPRESMATDIHPTEPNHAS